VTVTASGEARSAEDVSLVPLQIGRPPRSPWRVAARCSFGRPTVIASPSRLDDATPFPTLFWLTCLRLTQRVGELESEGGAARWAARAADDSALAGALAETQAALVALRREESGGVDACAGVGLAGQRDPAAVKCLHAHVALALAGVSDPIGRETLAELGSECPDDACARLLGKSVAEPGHVREQPARGARQ
jgi:hypothetical protein